MWLNLNIFIINFMSKHITRGGTVSLQALQTQYLFPVIHIFSE